MTAQGSRRRNIDWHYVGVSPQLLARVRTVWSALGLDVDAIWRETVPKLPGFRDVELDATLDSRPIDLLLIFDQGVCWAGALRAAAETLAAGPPGALTAAQAAGLAAVSSRLMDELAAVRTLALAGLALPAMQICRSISEDVDLALALLVRRNLAQAFAECRTPEDSAEFWRRHVAGGRAFRLVAQALYTVGLDYSEDSDYVRWRKEVLTFLGGAVHTSFASRAPEKASGGGLNLAAQECLYFAAIRIQEMCAYSLVVGRELRADLKTLTPQDGVAAQRLRFLRDGGDVILDQMRWLTEAREAAPRIN
jgi:hypothetical protein